MKINIAIDGYSSCGKSTVAKAVARALHYTYIDSGAMYRAITYYFLQHSVDTDSTTAVHAALQQVQLAFETQEDGNKHILLNGVDVESAIRTMEVANSVSKVAAIKEVRQLAVAQQQDMAKTKGVVMDGRDIGTVVFPTAELKLFMTASLEVRINRRWNELQWKEPGITKNAVKENLMLRDHIDTTRALDPLRQAADAIVLDNSDMTQQEQLDFVLHKVNEILQMKAVL